MAAAAARVGVSADRDASGAAPAAAGVRAVGGRRRDERGRGGAACAPARRSRPGRHRGRCRGRRLHAARRGRGRAARPAVAPGPRSPAGSRRRDAACGRARRDPGAIRNRRAQPRGLRRCARGVVAAARLGHRRPVHTARRAATAAAATRRQRAAVHPRPGRGDRRPGTRRAGHHGKRSFRGDHRGRRHVRAVSGRCQDHRPPRSHRSHRWQGTAGCRAHPRIPVHRRQPHPARPAAAVLLPSSSSTDRSKSPYRSTSSARYTAPPACSGCSGRCSASAR